MAADYYLRVKSAKGLIKGDSIVAGHVDEIQLAGWSMGLVTDSIDGPDVLEIRSREIDDLIVTKSQDSATLPLFMAACNGDLLPEVTLSARRPGDDVYATIVLTDAMVTSQLLGAKRGAQTGTEAVTFSFVKLKYSYRPQSGLGRLGPATTIEMTRQ